MKTVIIGVFLTLIYGSTSFAGPIYLVSDGNQDFLLKEGESYNYSGVIDNSAFGLCLENNCTKTFDMAAAFSKNLALSNAFFTIPEDQLAQYSFPSYQITSTS